MSAAVHIIPCHRCGARNRIVNECRCDPDNLPTTPQDADLTEFFGPIISAYTSAQAIEDGVLVDVTETAREAGFRCPVALTRAVWADCVEWTEQDEAQSHAHGQSERGRLWDVVWMARIAVKAVTRRVTPETITYCIKRHPRPGNGRHRLVTLKLHLGPGDTGEPVIIIMQPDED